MVGCYGDGDRRQGSRYRSQNVRPQRHRLKPLGQRCVKFCRRPAALGANSHHNAIAGRTALGHRQQRLGFATGRADPALGGRGCCRKLAQVVGGWMVGIRSRSDCSVASAAMRCQRSSFLGLG